MECIKVFARRPEITFFNRRPCFCSEPLRLEASKLGIQNRELHRPVLDRRPGFPKHANNSAQHPEFAGGKTVVAPAISAEWLIVAAKSKACDCCADPEIVVFVGSHRLVEAADHLVHAAAED